LKRRINRAALFIIILLACASVLGAQTSNGNGLVVEVTNSQGRPLKNACVTVIPKEGEITFRKADKNGKVRLKGIAPGSYRVVAKVDGYTAQKKQVEVSSSASETVAFSLQPGRAVE
jgi:archaellum component FlaG (FlaF/FlaG flagellin family)